MNKVAAIDIGSNSILLTIAENASPLKILVDEAHVTGLSKGLSKDGLIQPERIERSLKVFKRYRELLDEHQVSQVQVAATEAMRKAKNGGDVRKQIEDVLKLPVELISGEREAELSFWSVQKDFADKNIKKLVFDIGGASTELAYGAKDGIEHRVSLKVGSVLLTEKFGLKNKANGTDAFQYVSQMLKDLNWNIPECLGMGVAGTMTTLLAMEKSLQTYDRSKVHGQKISKERVAYWCEEVLSKSTEERGIITGLSPDRADVFGGGVTIIRALVEHFKWPSAICMDSGIRYGLIFEMLKI